MPKECSICAEVKSSKQFPTAPIARGCDHRPTTCRPCITRVIKTELSSKPWEEVACPECGATLEYQDVQKYADAETRERHDKLMVLHTLQQYPDFIWWRAEPIVRCTSCGHLTCFQHKVTWHEGVTCEEFDEAVEARHKAENDASEETIKSTTKACPGCKSQIEKHRGW
ncbi:hypothetical protein BBK36DRAFT_1181772 [Trichoderma citrinoviride]|uniref:RBR-type E3 ubiquitin transferase n=1 Tax=Trichoderma citrinoviride TaxID=58853 RepID=A0A2T4B2B2_9HYPO|nr:hypothetical protein BBK36DRAFT_1181772 [Trichoderma citrinoviride]PTB63378.1 hypothetical protein BBK36DRAFT_1181772 [Trichoderma citrinoviride]